VGQDGNVLDILVQSRRNKIAAKKFFRKLLKGLLYVPRVIYHRQAEALCCGEGRDHTGFRTPPAQGIEQPGGELTSTD
jgi:transposase-like protein